MKLHILLFLLALACCANADSGSNGEFVLLDRTKQSPEPLTWYLKHAPVNAPKSADEKANLAALPPGVSAHLAELGNLSGSRILSVRYLSDERLKNANAGALGLLVLASVPGNQAHFVPLIVAGGTDPDTIADYSASLVRTFGTTGLIWVRREYSGNARFVHRMALSHGEAAGDFRLFNPFANNDPLTALKTQGRELWTKGNYFDEETLDFHFHLHKKPDPKKPDGDYPHRYYRVRYTFKGGKFVPGKPVHAPQGQ